MAIVKLGIVPTCQAYAPTLVEVLRSNRYTCDLALSHSHCKDRFGAFKTHRSTWSNAHSVSGIP